MTSGWGMDSHCIKGKRFLIADDLEGNRVLAAMFLTIAGGEVEVVSNGSDAISKAMDGNYDAILMDIHMPGVDGLTATYKLRQSGYRKPIIVISSDSRTGIKERAFDIGASSFVSKPLTLTCIAQVLKRFFTNSSSAKL